jgi:DNA-binding CsgD family transcriptional regulator
MTISWKPATLGTSRDREVAPFAESLLSRWDAPCASEGAGQPRCCINDPLSARERDVLVMISQGLSNKRIGRALEISPETVKSHVKHIFLKLEVSTRTEAVFQAISLRQPPKVEGYQAHGITHDQFEVRNPRTTELAADLYRPPTADGVWRSLDRPLAASTSA